MGRKCSKPQIRALLKNHPDGLTAKQIGQAINRDHKHLHYTLHTMPDAYIDRWVALNKQYNHIYSAVWCVVDVPENCPRPKKK